MIPVAIWVAHRIDRYGYWRLIMLALLVMPVRAALAASTDAPLMMIPVQILDGLAVDSGRRGTVVYRGAVARERARQCRAERGDADAGGWGIHESGVNRHDCGSLLICHGIQCPERDCAGGRPAVVVLCAPDLGNRQYAGWGIAATRRHAYASSLGHASPFSSCCRLPSVVSEMLISASAVRNAWCPVNSTL